MTKNQIKKLILKGHKLDIQTTIFFYWNLDKRQQPQLPYKN